MYIDIFSYIDPLLLPGLLLHLKIFSGRVFASSILQKYIYIYTCYKKTSNFMHLYCYTSPILYSIDHLIAHAFVPL